MAMHFQVTTTAPSRDDAIRLAQLGVERRLAACAQVSGPITSVYRWDNRIHNDDEWVCVFKTSAAALEPLTAALRQAHHYDTPEIVAVAIDQGDADYLAWVDAETAGG